MSSNETKSKSEETTSELKESQDTEKVYYKNTALNVCMSTILLSLY